VGFIVVFVWALPGRTSGSGSASRSRGGFPSRSHSTEEDPRTATL